MVDFRTHVIDAFKASSRTIARRRASVNSTCRLTQHSNALHVR
jgi:hypothetical protein